MGTGKEASLALAKQLLHILFNPFYGLIMARKEERRVQTKYMSFLQNWGRIGPRKGLKLAGAGAKCLAEMRLGIKQINVL